MGNLQAYLTVVPAIGLAISIVALFRPEISSAIRRIFTTIDFFPEHKLEIGYSLFGPTIGFVGSLRAIHGDQFVTEIGAELTRRHDNATYKFRWIVFRSNRVTQKLEEIEMASAFLLPNGQTSQKNVLLHDQGTNRRIQAELLTLRREFQDSLTAEEKIKTSLDKALLIQAASKFLLNSSKAQSALTTLLSNFYWQEGSYDLVICIRTSRPDKSIKKRYSFSLRGEEIESVRANVFCIQMETLGISDVKYQFIYPDYGKELTPIRTT